MIKKYLVQILLVLAMLIFAWGLYLLGEDPEDKNKEKIKNNPPIEASIYQAAGDATSPNERDTGIVDEKDYLSEHDLNPEVIPIRKWTIEDPVVLARSVIAINFHPNSKKGNILFQKNKNEILPIASLTKIMTAIVALENFDIEEVIKVSKNSVQTLGDKGGLIRGEELSVNDLLNIMLIESSNDAAMALANDNSKVDYEGFINLMNDKAKELGLKNTKFLDPIGLNSKNKSTVEDLAHLVKYSFNFPLIWEILKIPEKTIYSIDNKFIHNLINTNELLDKISFLRGGKTGFTNDAGGCMLAVFDIQDSLGFNNYLITVVLGSDDREEDIETLINWVKEAYLW